MPRLKLGIDLQGGTYLILGVGIDKAMEDKLKSESKELDQLFKTEKLKSLPTKKDFQLPKQEIATPMSILVVTMGENSYGYCC